MLTSEQIAGIRRLAVRRHEMHNDGSCTVKANLLVQLCDDCTSAAADRDRVRAECCAIIRRHITVEMIQAALDAGGKP